MITGLGTVGAWGCGSGALARALAAGVPPAATAVDRSAGYHRRCGARRALLTPMAALAEWVPPAEARRMSPPSRLAVAAARMAVGAAGLAAADVAGLGTAVVTATVFGPSSFSDALLLQIVHEGPQAVSPYLFSESVANAPTAQIAIACGARGPNLTLCQGEAGALLAVARAAAAVMEGRAERALAGAVDEMPAMLHGLLDRFGTLAHRPCRAAAAPGAPPPPASPDPLTPLTPLTPQDTAVRRAAAAAAGGESGRPFDRRRNGVVAADGATILVLETAAAAARRGAAPLAHVRAWGSAFDPSASTAGWGSGAPALGRSLRRAMERRGVAMGAIDRIASGASGSRGGDRLEAGLLRAAWGDAALPPVLAPKAVTGEYGGGFLAAALLAAAGASYGPTAGFAEPDPRLGVVPHDGRRLPPPALLLASSVAAGGAVAWLLLAAGGAG